MGPPQHASNTPSYALLVVELALPQHDHSKSELLEILFSLGVSLSIAGEFLTPEISIPLRNRGARAAFVAVPETAMNECGPAPAAVGQIRSTRQVLIIRPVVQALLAE